MDEQILSWRDRLQVKHRKVGRSLITAIIHVVGDETPPIEALSAAAAEWTRIPAANVVRRPDANGEQVYWINIVATP